jgi:peptide/nickel transport system permease protein
MNNRSNRAAASPARRFLSAVRRFFREKPLGATGAVILLFFILIALLAPFISPYEPNTIDIKMRMQDPSVQHWLGTDQLGRDILSRIIWGTQVSMFIGITATLGGSLIGAIIGIISGYAGGKVDIAIQRVMDIVMAFPALVLIMAIMVALGQSVVNVIIALIIPLSSPANRVARSVTLAVKEFQYIEAAKAVNAGYWRILFRHIAPNTLASYLIITSSMLGGIILTEASLSFLGLGVPPPNASWGRSLNEALIFVTSNPLLAVWPGLAISLVVFGVNVFGDALRDFWDPRLKRL